MIFQRSSKKQASVLADDIQASVVLHGFGVIQVLDLRGLINSKGVSFDRECIVLEVCSPRHAAEILVDDPRISMLLPCRISIFEHDEGLAVGTILPTALIEGFDSSDEIVMLAKVVEVTLLEIIEDSV